MVLLDLPPMISTERLTLQKLRYEEAEEIFYAYASKPEATRYVSWPTHRNIDDTLAFLAYAEQGWRTGIDYSFAVRLKSSSRLIGSFGVMNNNGRLQFGYIYSPTQWGRGYATEACTGMMGILKKLPVHEIKTFTDADNIASVRVLIKSGLVEDGRMEKWFRFVNQGDEPKDCLQFRLPLIKHQEA